MRGRCAKTRVLCEIRIGEHVFVGENDCLNAQASCPRAPGEGYEKCRSICQQSGHAEIEALKKAGHFARDAAATVYGHYHCCEPCAAALRDAGVRSVTIYLKPAS